MKRFLESFLAWCVHRAIRRERPRIVAIAGSVGKSSTKEAIGRALGAGDAGSSVRASAKNYNNELGVPLAILNDSAPGRSVLAWLKVLLHAKLLLLGLRRIGAKTLVLEFGTDHPGDLAHLIKIAPPTIGVLTAIGAEHTEFFGSIEGVAKEERSLIASLPKHGIAILNADDPAVLIAVQETDATVVTFGESPHALVRLLSTHLVIDEQDPHASGLDVRIAVQAHVANIRLRGTFGKPQAFAAAAAMAVAYAMDEDFSIVADRLATCRPLPGRTRILEGIKHTTLLDDTYNSSPLAVHSAIRDLASVPIQDGCRRIVALGDMLELGSLAESSHADEGRAVANAGIDMLVCCGTLAHVVARAAAQAGMPEDRIFVFAKSPEAGLFIQERLKQGDVVLIKGSQGARMEKITKELLADPLRASELLVRQTGEWEEKVARSK